MTTEQLADQVTAAFNRHGSFTARRLPMLDASVEVRYLDSGDIAATVWPPRKIGGAVKWMWLGGQPGMGIRYLPETGTVHVLDERPKR